MVRRALFQLALVLLAAAPARAEPVNAIAGDVSFVERFHRIPEPRDDRDPSFRVRVHLEWVVRELRANLDGQRAPSVRRAKLLDALEAYASAERFPINRHYANRRPRFMDEEGRLCAVGHLIAITSGPALAHAIVARFEYERLLDMDDPRLDAWVARSGFTARELAMIQPEYGGRNLVTAGDLAFAEGRYREALRHFERAYQLMPRPALLYRVALAAERAGELDRALTSYRRFLEEEPATEHRAQIEATIARLERELASPPSPPVTAAVVPAANRGCACQATRAPTRGASLPWLAALVAWMTVSRERSLRACPPRARSRLGGARR